jgi:hypothetical protein
VRLVLGGGTQVMAALLAIVLGVAIYIVHRDHVYTGHTTARALDHRTVPTAAPAYHVDVAYRDGAGRDHTGTIFVNKWPIEQTYPVDYDPEHPDRVRWHQPWYTNIVLVVVLFGFGNLALGGLAVAMLVGVKKLRRRDSIRGGPALPLLVLPAGCVALSVWLVQLLRS